MEVKVHVIPKLDSPPFPRSAETLAYEAFLRDYPKVVLLHPAREGNGLWVAKWISPARAECRLALRAGQWEVFFKALRTRMRVDFPDE